ncbi:antibiotic biosynthesis monooxygenase [Kaistella haifensis]|nr:antibiotic biosynthesis monooxygenase [Kaistella haifensis]
MFRPFVLFVACAVSFNCLAQNNEPEKNRIIVNNNIDTTKIISLYGFLRPKKGYEDELRASLLLLVQPTRAEEGSLVYNVHEEKDGSFFLYEVWRSQEDLDKHWQQPYLKDFMSKVENLIDGKVEGYSGKLISGLSD